MRLTTWKIWFGFLFLGVLLMIVGGGVALLGVTDEARQDRYRRKLCYVCSENPGARKVQYEGRFALWVCRECNPPKRVSKTELSTIEVDGAFAGKGKGWAHFQYKALMCIGGVIWMIGFGICSVKIFEFPRRRAVAPPHRDASYPVKEMMLSGFTLIHVVHTLGVQDACELENYTAETLGLDEAGVSEVRGALALIGLKLLDDPSR